MFNEDNSGFVFFPYGERIVINQGSKTLIYLVAIGDSKSNLSNLNIILPGDFVSDDVNDRNNSTDIIKNDHIQREYNDVYFPNTVDDISRLTSIPLVSCICIGWSQDSYEFHGFPWKATFRDLTEEGKRLYYSIKKLHNSKEVRILTFNNI